MVHEVRESVVAAVLTGAAVAGELILRIDTEQHGADDAVREWHGGG